MTNKLPNSKAIAPIQGAVNMAWPYLTGRSGLILLASGVTIGGLAMNWGWLVAAGIAPLLLSALPCAAMCALGLCMSKASGRTGSNSQSTADLPNEPETGISNSLEEKISPRADGAPTPEAVEQSRSPLTEQKETRQ